MFQTDVVEKIETHFMFWNFFRKHCRLWDNVEKCGGARGAADDNMAARWMLRLHARKQTPASVHTHTHTHTHREKTVVVFVTRTLPVLLTLTVSRELWRQDHWIYAASTFRRLYISRSTRRYCLNRDQTLHTISKAASAVRALLFYNSRPLRNSIPGRRNYAMWHSNVS